MRRSGGAARSWWAVAAVAFALALVASACEDSPSALDPKSDSADRIAGIWWALLGIGAVVWVIVVLLLFIALFHRRAGVRDGSRQPVGWVLIAGAVIPLVILTGTLILTIVSLSPVIGETAASEADVRIKVTGHQWWWEVEYPDDGFTTANEIHIPVDRDVHFTLESVDVIHSLWVPQLQGKADLIPGKSNTLSIHATEEGVYRGQCAEFCGLQHAKMAFTIVVESQEEYDRWIANQREPAGFLERDQAQLVDGQQVFMGSGCVYCHTIRGTSASGEVGPDLTHLASRDEIAAGTLDNNRANLTAWILDPQHFKFGNLMPGTTYESEELQALIAYLESLE